LKKQTKITYAGIKNRRNIKTILLSVVFMMCIPNKLNAGNKIGTIKNAFSGVVKLRFGREKIGSLFVLYPMIVNTQNAILNEIKRERIVNGVS
jgi:hypothetical protein